MTGRRMQNKVFAHIYTMNKNNKHILRILILKMKIKKLIEKNTRHDFEVVPFQSAIISQ